MTPEELFYEIIRVSIGVQNHFLCNTNDYEWAQVYKMAEKHALLGICFVGLQKIIEGEGFSKSGINESTYLNWLGVAAKIQSRNEHVNQQCVELQRKLTNDGFRSCILKGQGIAALYKSDPFAVSSELNFLRQIGDIDVWIDGTREQVLDYVNARTPSREFDMKHTHYEVFEDTVVETHWRPSVSNDPFVNRKLTAYFDREKERQFANRVTLKGGHEICAPTADFQLIHAMLHLYGHFLYEGVGMRQMMDLYFAQKAGLDCRDRLMKTLKSLRLMRFVSATQYVMKEVFGMPQEELLCNPDKKRGEELLNEIMLGGNFGHHSKENRIKGETFAQRMMRHMKRRVRLIRFNPLGLLFAPWAKVRVLLWKRKVIKKYNL